jgi:hypothetical protein
VPAPSSSGGRRGGHEPVHGTRHRHRHFEHAHATCQQRVDHPGDSAWPFIRTIAITPQRSISATVDYVCASWQWYFPQKAEHQENLPQANKFSQFETRRNSLSR